jgi:hypothetical protein
MTTEVPFGAKPYLCVSHEMEVTPLTRKSNTARNEKTRIQQKKEKKARKIRLNVKNEIMK